VNSLKSFFLRAAHWQIFLLVSGLYAADLLIDVSIIGVGPIPAKDVPPLTVLLLQASAMFVFGVFFLWLWSMGYFLNFLVKPPLRMDFGVFRFALVFPLLYGVAFPLLVLGPRSFNAKLVLAIHLFMMLCVIYAFRFVSKSLALVEETRYLTFRDYYQYFFLLWFFPIGVWWIQPRINRLYQTQASRLP
jgi:hypothetical protein